MKNFKQFIVFTIGLIIFGFGISFGNKSLLGGNPMSILVVGMSLNLPLSVGTCNLILSFIETGIGYTLDKTNVTLATVFGAVCGSYAIDLANLFIPDTTSLTIRVIYMLVGIVLYCFGLALQQASRSGYGNLDCFIFGLKKVFKVEKYHRVRWCTDIGFIISGVLLGGTFGIGTVILLLVGGIIIEFFRKQIEKVY